MDFVADESLDFRIIGSLRQHGHQVFAIVEESPSIDDASVLEVAVSRKSILITEDKDFGELTFRLKKTHFGILLLKLSGLEITEKIDLVLSVVKNQHQALFNSFAVLDQNRLRIKTGKK
ncbi:MAG: DUF5615 family PIN-like protein [Imperialibacter sp.]|uniref:DUF5615 family PIN-like protein n=1 Tax=Imperialibacter sp. TaxID=2038411 RepID=UPI0032EC4EC0